MLELYWSVAQYKKKSNIVEKNNNLPVCFCFASMPLKFHKLMLCKWQYDTRKYLFLLFDLQILRFMAEMVHSIAFAEAFIHTTKC